MKYNKKASLNLSIQAIVIVVIAFVVLGLGLGFVKSQFSQMQTTSSQVQEQISQQILDDLRTGNKPLSFPASKLALTTNEESVQAIGLKNTRDSPIKLSVVFEVRNNEGSFEAFSSAETLGFSSTSGDVSSTILWDDSEQPLSAGENKVLPVTIKAPDKIGNYLYKVKLIDLADNTEFASKTFFIKTN